MGKLPRERTVDGVIAREPREVLRQGGFKRKGRNFHRVRGDFVHSVWFQTMRGSPSVFCVNLTLIQPEHHRLWSGRALPTSPCADNSVFLTNRRVAFDTPDGENHWWIIRSSEDAAPISAHVAARVSGSLGFFNEWRSLAELIRAVEVGNDDRLPAHKLDLPILLVAQGDSRRAAALLKTISGESDLGEVLDRLKDELGAAD